MFDKTKSIVDLLIERPFFGVVLSRINIMGRSHINTMATDGRSIYYNADWANSITAAEQIGVFAHEVLHIVFCHHVRAKGREHDLWNVACDMAINPLLEKEGFALPVGAFRDDHDPPRSAEEIYNDLKAKGVKIVYVSWGDVCTTTEDDAIEEERVIKVIGSAYSQSQGKMSAGLSRAIQDILSPPVHWTEVLRNALSQVIKDRYCYTKFNRRWVRSGLYLPALHSPTLNLVIAVDTSGSVDDSELSAMAATVNDIKTQVRSTVRVIYCDSAICGEEFFDIDEQAALHPCGGGGTDYIPVFEHIKDVEDISALIYLTDGFCDSYPDRDTIDYPVIWVYMQNDQDVTIDIW